VHGSWRPTREPVTDSRRRWLVAGLVALLLQIPLGALILYVIEHSVSDVEFKPVGIEPIALLEPESPDPEEEEAANIKLPILDLWALEEETEDELPDIVPDGTETPVGQIVTVAPPEEEIMPEEARYASRYAVKVDEEVKAAQPSKDQKVPKKYQPEIQPEMRPQARKGTKSKDFMRSTDQAGTEASELGSEYSPEGTEPAAGDPHNGEDGFALIAPELAGRDPVSKYQPSAAPFASDDFVPDVEKTGETNLLNTVPYRYAGFFERVKRGVRRHWDPNRIYRLRDPDGELYGHKDRYTVLSVVLDDRGYVLDTTITSPSGLKFLDNEALRAFGAAGPFLNPPNGLASDDGKIRFDFGFAFLIASSRQQFFWRWQ
jgi:outer membrane biosynthesis protein TonB